jgi:hypothetical protein
VCVCVSELRVCVCVEVFFVVEVAVS